MSPCLCIVLAAAVAAGPALPPDFDRLERRMQELVEQERFEELAREGETAFGHTELLPWQRRALAFYAVRGLHGVSEASGQAAVLCRARALLRRVEREVGLDDDAATAARLRERTEQKLREQGLKDPCTPARPRPVAGTATQPAQLLPVRVDPPATSSPAVRGEADEQPVLIDISRRPPSPSTRPPRPTFHTQPAPAIAPASPAPPEPEVSRSRGRIVGGSLLLVAGAGFAAGMAAALVRRSEANTAILAIDKKIKVEDRDVTDAEVALALREDTIYRRSTLVAGVTGAAAVITTVAGITLLALPRQDRRTTATLSASPWSATLTLAGQF